MSSYLGIWNHLTLGPVVPILIKKGFWVDPSQLRMCGREYSMLHPHFDFFSFSFTLLVNSFFNSKLPHHPTQELYQLLYHFAFFVPIPS